MDARKLVLGGLTAFAVGMALSLLWHVVLMSGFYEAAADGAMRDPPIIWSVALGYLVVGFVMAYMYPKGHEGGSPLAEGLKFGVLIGLVWWLPTQLVLYGAIEGPSSMILVDGGWHLIEQGLTGVALAMVHDKLS